MLLKPLRASLVVQMILCLQCRRPRFDPWVGKILCRWEWLPTPVFLLGEFHGPNCICGLHETSVQAIVNQQICKKVKSYYIWGVELEIQDAIKTHISLLILLYFLTLWMDYYLLHNWKVKVAQSCLTLCTLMDYTLHGILQASILEWVTFPFYKGSSQPRDQIQASCLASGFFISWATREAQE